MKKLFLSLLIAILFASCKVTQVFMGMSEQQYNKEHSYAERVEISASRNVYKELYNTGYKFYYFKEGKMYLMDEGYIPFGTKTQVPSR
ncbi:MAG: hypothetical protein JWQ34_1652 [Mucilaginibacter sp.]|uniref:hypothetical protein n=1 Tax=Mucilaginibacter sp. TaxID=1882438 RepID=UPI002605D5E5|nr:hypothetical protein [Mucilaginibacter sp.]MDB5003427.1 hypothetical protein [Mucilaginibacter sp.]